MENLSRVKVDSRQGLLNYLGTEWVLLRVEALQGMFDETFKAFGSGSLTIWYLAGKGAGKAMAELIIGLGRELSPRQLIEKICSELSQLGWGRFEIEEWDENRDRYVFRVYNNPFGRGRETAKETACIYVKGYLEGMLEVALKKPVKLKETMCIAEGAPYCRFASET